MTGSRIEFNSVLDLDNVQFTFENGLTVSVSRIPRGNGVINNEVAVIDSSKPKGEQFLFVKPFVQPETIAEVMSLAQQGTVNGGEL